MGGFSGFLRNREGMDGNPVTMTPPLEMSPSPELSPLVQHPMHAMVAPIMAAPPPPAPMGMDGTAPTAKQPAPMSPIDKREGELEQGLMKKPEGFWQKFGHAAGMAGKIAGDVVAPAETELVTKELGKEGIGPEANQFRNKELAGLEKQESEQNLQGAQAGLATATAGHTNAETPEVAPNAESLRKYQGAETQHAQAETANLENPPDATPEIGTYRSLVKMGMSPSQALQEIERDKAMALKPTTFTPEEQAYDQAFKELTGKGMSPSQAIEKLKEHPPSIRIETPGEERGAKNDILKAYQPALDSSERMNVMTDAYEKAVKSHDQQAMLNLLANHLGMTMGLQKGSRLTRDIIREAQQSTPWLKGLEARFDSDGYLTGVTLTKPQMLQMVSLGQERYAEDARKGRSTAQYLGAKDDGPDRTPGTATKNYYLGIANGDRNKAMQLMENDGWTVPSGR